MSSPQRPPPGFGHVADPSRQQQASDGAEAELERLRMRQTEVLETDALDGVEDNELSSMFKSALGSSNGSSAMAQQQQPMVPPHHLQQDPRSFRQGGQYQMQPPPGMQGFPPGMRPPPPNMQGPPPGMQVPPFARHPNMQGQHPGMMPGVPPQYMGMPPPQMPMSATPVEEKDPYTFDLSNQERIPDMARMKGFEIFNLIRFQRGAGQTDDSYSDDYYFLQCREKKRKQRMGILKPDAPEVDQQSSSSRPAHLLEEMMKVQDGGVSALSGGVDVASKNTPLPELPGSVHLPKEFEVIRGKATESWHKNTSVLGKTAKSNLKTPRALLNFDEVKISSDVEAVFAGTQWKLRRLVSDVADVLLEIEDVHRILRAKIGAMPRGQHKDNAFNSASQKVIDDLERKQVRLCDRLGTLLGFSSIAEGTVTLDKMQLRGVLWLEKGRRLLCRATGSLLPMHHEALMYAVAEMMVFFVCLSPEGATSDSSEEREKAEVDMYCARSMAAELASLPISQITDCLTKFLQCQSPESLRAVIATPGGAEIVRSILMHGQSLVESTNVDETQKSEWSTAFAKFIAMAEEGIRASTEATS